MRRFSERSHLVTLSEINITPLLDLAFVLLIIFVITTPLLENSITVKLPNGGRETPKIDKSNIRTVEITSTGYYKLEKKMLRRDQLFAQLTQEAHANPNLIVYIRADRDSRYELLAGLFDTCQHNGITIAMATDPKPER
jgi:biopolymer transport protein ExbD